LTAVYYCGIRIRRMFNLHVPSVRNGRRYWHSYILIIWDMQMVVVFTVYLFIQGVLWHIGQTSEVYSTGNLEQKVSNKL
jgi:hypothetical protein